MSIVYIRFSARASNPLQRSPLIERLIARSSDLVRVADWRTEAFGFMAPEGAAMPPIVAMAAQAAPGLAGAWACVATPVHLSAGMSSVAMREDGIQALSRDEAGALAADFNTMFSGSGARLAVTSATVLLCVFDRALDVVTHDPEAAAGRDVFDFQPVGADAPELRRLMSEMEMWLFDHAVNRRRAVAGRAAVTGLWLWGGGAIGSVLPAVSWWAAGPDPFFGVSGAAAGIPEKLGTGREAGAGREAGNSWEPGIPAAAGGRWEGRPGVVVCNDRPGSDTWPDVERRWLEPALAALRAGRLRRIHVSALQRRVSIAARPSLRFWRRPRPWWESFELMDQESNDVQ